MLNNDFILMAIFKFNPVNCCHNIDTEGRIAHLYYIT